MQIMRNNISRKQVGVIYKAMKDGRIQISKENMSIAYNICDQEIDNSGRATEISGLLEKAVNEIFNNNINEAQEWIDIAFHTGQHA